MKKFLMIVAALVSFSLSASAAALSFNGQECKSILIQSKPTTVTTGVAGTATINNQLFVQCDPLDVVVTPLPPEVGPVAPAPLPNVDPVVGTCSLSGNAGTKQGTIFASCSTNIVTYEWSEPGCARYAMSCTVYPNPTGTYTMRGRNASGVTNTATITLTLFGH